MRNLPRFLSVLGSLGLAWTCSLQAAQTPAPPPANAAPADFAPPLITSTKAADKANWLDREKLKKNEDLQLIGEVLTTATPNKEAACTLRIYIRPPAPAAPAKPDPKKKETAPAAPPPEPVAKQTSFLVIPANKAMGEFLKTLAATNLAPSATLQGEFEDKDDKHTKVEEWKKFRCTKILFASMNAEVAKEKVAERDRRAEVAAKQLTEGMGKDGAMTALEKADKAEKAKPKPAAPALPKDPKKRAEEEKKLVEEEK